MRKRNRLLVEMIKTIKEFFPCKDCQNNFPYYIMEFDHSNPSNKIDNISKMVYHSSKTEVLEEIKKCDLICSNCHKIREHKKLYPEVKNALSKD